MINSTDKENIAKLINIETASIKATLNIQKNLNRQILSFMKNIIGNIKIEVDFEPTNKAFYYMNKSALALNQSNTNISAVKNLLQKLEKIDFSKNKIDTPEFEQDIKTYNNEFNDSINAIYESTDSIEKFIREISLLDLSLLLQELNTPNKAKTIQDCEDTTDDIIPSDILNTSFVENTLIISETQKKVILPYKLEKIREILLDNDDKFSSMEDIIEKLYTKPIKYYRFSAAARFKEAYKLITKKEHGSKMKAFSLASELFGNYNLHPAIITACDSLNTLDIYLACLEDNTLEDFKFFNIKYEITPAIKLYT